MKAKKLTLLTLLFASFSMALGMTSCGGRDEPVTPPGPVDPDEGGTDPDVKPDPDEDKDAIIIDFWNTFNQQQIPTFENISRQFEKLILKEENVKVKIKSTPIGGYDEMATQIINGFNIGRTPTIAVAYPDNVAQYIAMEEKPGDYIVDLEPLMNDPKIGFTAEKYLCTAGADDFVPAYLDEGRHYKRSGTLSLPFEKSTELMLYNKDIVNKAKNDLGYKNIPVEHYMNTITWKNFLELTNHINNNREKYGMVSSKGNEKYVTFYDSDSNLFITQAYQRNIPYIDLVDGQGKILFNNPQSIALMKELREYHNKGLLCTHESEGVYGSDYFKNGQCIFTVGSSGGSGYSDPKAEFEVGVTKFPFYQEKLEDGTYQDIPEDRQKLVSQGVTLALFSNPAANKEVNEKRVLYGWKFLKFITNPVNSISMCMASKGYVPPRLSSYEVKKYKDFINGKGYMNKCANAVINTIDGKYYNFPVFQGSAVARDEVGATINKVFMLKDNELNKVDALVKDAANKAILALEDK